MTPIQKYRYLRLVLHLISRRKWRNGCIVALAREALKRVERPAPLPPEPVARQRETKSRAEQEATIIACGCLVENYTWDGKQYRRI